MTRGEAIKDFLCKTLLPAAVAAPFSAAMAQSMLLPIAVLALGLVAACFLERPSVLAKTRH